jgi:hypothetical protein
MEFFSFPYRDCVRNDCLVYDIAWMLVEVEMLRDVPCSVLRDCIFWD